MYKHANRYLLIFSFVIFVLLLQCEPERSIIIDEKSIQEYPYGLVQDLPDIGDSNRIEVYIADSTMEIRLQRDTLRFVFQEFHKYVSTEDSTEHIVRNNHLEGSVRVRHPFSGKPMDTSEIRTVMTYIMNEVVYHKALGQVTNMAGEPIDSTFPGMPVYVMAREISGPWIVVRSSRTRSVDGYPTISQNSLDRRLQNSNEMIFYTLFRLLLKRYIGPQINLHKMTAYSPEQISNISNKVTLVIRAPLRTTPAIRQEVEKMGRILGMKTEREYGAEE